MVVKSCLKKSCLKKSCLYFRLHWEQRIKEEWSVGGELFHHPQRSLQERTCGWFFPQMVHFSMIKQELANSELPKSRLLWKCMNNRNTATFGNSFYDHGYNFGGATGDKKIICFACLHVLMNLTQWLIWGYSAVIISWDVKMPFLLLHRCPNWGLHLWLWIL